MSYRFPYLNRFYFKDYLNNFIFLFPQAQNLKLLHNYLYDFNTIFVSLFRYVVETIETIQQLNLHHLLQNNPYLRLYQILIGVVDHYNNAKLAWKRLNYVRFSNTSIQFLRDEIKVKIKKNDLIS